MEMNISGGILLRLLGGTVVMIAFGFLTGVANWFFILYEIFLDETGFVAANGDRKDVPRPRREAPAAVQGAQVGTRLAVARRVKSELCSCAFHRPIFGLDHCRAGRGGRPASLGRCLPPKPADGGVALNELIVQLEKADFNKISRLPWLRALWAQHLRQFEVRPRW